MPDLIPHFKYKMLHNTLETLQRLRNFSSLNFYEHLLRVYLALYVISKSAVGILKQDHAQRIRLSPNTFPPSVI
jgi:hypothetical protein